MGFAKTKEKVKKKRFLESLVNSIFKKIISGTLVISMIVPQIITPVAYGIGVASDAISSSSSKSDATEEKSITLDKEFLEFTSFGQKEILSYTIMPENSKSEEVVFSVSNPESVKVTRCRRSNLDCRNRSCCYNSKFEK